MENQAISSSVENYIVEELIVGDKNQKLDYDQSLVNSGVIDSLAILRLITFLEENFDITVEDEEVVPENFDTINIITEFVANKKS